MVKSIRSTLTSSSLVLLSAKCCSMVQTRLLLKLLIFMQDWGVIEFLYIQGQHASSSPGKRLIRLSPAYQDESVLEDFIYKLGR